MFLIFLGIADVVIAVALGLAHFGFVFTTFMKIAAALALLKGFGSIVVSIASGWWFDIMGVLDIAAGIVLFLVLFDLSFAWLHWLALAMLAKGAYSIISGFV